MFEMDSTMTIAISNDDSVFHMYSRLSCDKYIEKIRIPSLFINAEDDPVSKPEFIPLDSLYSNPNCITLITSKGGHGQFLSSWKFEYYIFKIVMDYLVLLEEKNINL